LLSKPHASSAIFVTGYRIKYSGANNTQLTKFERKKEKRKTSSDKFKLNMKS
jgi:hypothetical protein